jgi:hypothetical protein
MADHEDERRTLEVKKEEHPAYMLRNILKS